MHPSPAAQALAARIETDVRETGFAFIAHDEARALLSEAAIGALADFAASWDDLGEDTYMADGGRYRRRRHGVFELNGGALTRLPHQAHYQSRDYNRLNGGVQRWFAPIEPHVAANPLLLAIIGVCAQLMAAFEPAHRGVRRVEAHQFRIAPSAGDDAHPTPEGMHRDGVDWVCVVLLRRVNVARGETAIADPCGQTIGAFTLTEPLDMVFLDDRRVAHGVTPIQRLDPDWPGFRDALVLTFSAQAG